MNFLQVEKLYLGGLSSYQIGRKFNVKSDYIRTYLYRKGLLRKALGRDIEEKVAKWFEKQSIKVSRQKGTHPYDLMVGKERIDVKSAHLSCVNRVYNYYGYSFQLQDLTERRSEKNFEEELDWFILVFLDEDGVPMYKVKPSDITAKRNLKIYFGKSKLPLKFIGNLN